MGYTWVFSLPQARYEDGAFPESFDRQDSSGAYASDARNAFQNTFGYNATLATHNNTSMVWSNLPVYMRGSTQPSGGDGHAWVCDGARTIFTDYVWFIELLVGSPGSYEYVSVYDMPSIQNPFVWENILQPTDSFHMNWGWANGSDGWFHDNLIAIPLGNFKYNRQNMYVSPK